MRREGAPTPPFPYSLTQSRHEGQTRPRVSIARWSIKRSSSSKTSQSPRVSSTRMPSARICATASCALRATLRENLPTPLLQGLGSWAADNVRGVSLTACRPAAAINAGNGFERPAGSDRRTRSGSSRETELEPQGRPRAPVVAGQSAATGWLGWAMPLSATLALSGRRAHLNPLLVLLQSGERGSDNRSAS